MNEYLYATGESQRQLGGAPATSYTFFLPLNYNDGRRIPSDRLLQAQSKILLYSDGLTRLPPGEGLWNPPPFNKLYREPILPVQAVSSYPKAESHFASLASEMAILLEQRQIFLFAQPVYLMAE